MGESSQKPIKIDQNLWRELDSWLKSKHAKNLGYHSKADFATQAIREFLEKYTSGRNIESEIYDKLSRIESDLNLVYGKKIAAANAKYQKVRKIIDGRQNKQFTELEGKDFQKRALKLKEQKMKLHNKK